MTRFTEHVEAFQSRHPRRWKLVRRYYDPNIWVCFEQTESGQWLYVKEVECS